jgi:hypothetical protein
MIGRASTFRAGAALCKSVGLEVGALLDVLSSLVKMNGVVKVGVGVLKNWVVFWKPDCVMTVVALTVGCPGVLVTRTVEGTDVEERNVKLEGTNEIALERF